MSEIYFSDSFGGKEPLTNFEWLKERIFNGDDNFWEGVTGDCGLNYSDGWTSSALALIGREKFGFMLEYSNFETNENAYTLRGDECGQQIVEVETAGEPKNYYKKYFVPKEVAWQAIKYFLTMGERDPSLTWEVADYPKQS